jgi:hypothetical protein
VLSVCCLSGSRSGRLAALLELLRPVAGELVVALDERRPLDRLGRVPELADTLVRYPYAEPVERPFAWLASLCTGDWILRIDDDEVPSAALLELLAGPPADLSHAWIPRRWLWGEGWLSRDPWAPDWQLRLVRPEAAQYPGRMHIPISASGPHAYLDAPLYHLDLVVHTRKEREEKARRYERIRPGLRIGGLPLNVAYYLPELRPDAPVAPVPPDDRPLVEAIAGAEDPRPSRPSNLRRATREEIDAYWADGPLPEPAYAARIELGPLPCVVAGEIGQLDVMVTNTGTVTWPVELPEIRIAYRFEGDDRAGLRTRFPHRVAPGGTVCVPVSFEAPARSGRYTLVVDLVHERHRWFGCGAASELDVGPRRRALVLVGQPPGDETFDRRVDDVLAALDPQLEPFLVGPRPEWLRDRFGLEAAEKPPAWAPEQVLTVPAGRRRDRVGLAVTARRLRRRAGR